MTLSNMKQILCLALIPILNESFILSEIFSSIFSCNWIGLPCRSKSPVFSSRENIEFSLKDDDDRYPQYKGMFEVDEGTSIVPEAGIIIVDSFCEYLGKYVSNEVQKRGYACVTVLSDHLLNFLKDETAKSFRAPKQGIDTHVWASELPFPIVGVISESDAGLETAERLQSDLCGSGMNYPWEKYYDDIVEYSGGINPSRRDKFLMNEAIRKAGLPAVRQRKVKTKSDVEEFKALLEIKDNAPIILKPLRGCASSDVYLCGSNNKIIQALDSIIGFPVYSCPGELNKEVLAQEYLVGDEYAIDTVSRFGVHKVMAIWKYQKMPANGASFVYLRTEMRDPTGPEERAIIDYVRAVLNVLNVKIGAAHTEVMMTVDGPKLIEYNGRWHLTDFKEICNRCVTYNAVDVTIDAFLDPPKFDALPLFPIKLHQFCSVVHLVCHVEGKVEALNHIDTIRSLRSYFNLDVYPSYFVGEEVKPTIDIRTDAGWVHLCHQDSKVVQEDYETLLALMPTMFSVSELSF